MKNSFNFNIKTELVFGKDTELQVASLIKKYGGHNILVVAGQSSVFQSGLYDRVCQRLNKENLTHHLLKGVRANPTFALAKEGVKLVKENNIDFILAIGGGSVIDTAKCIAVNAFYDGDIRDFNFHKVEPQKALPLGSILTLAASGSEMSISCVMQDDELGAKMGFLSELIRPVFAIENPELTYSVNKEQTAYGVVDILMHTIERYFSPSDQFELADELALGLIKNVIDVGLLVYCNPTNYDYRARMMLASTISHAGYTSIGKNYMMPIHQLEHALSGCFPRVAHGCGLAILFPAWASEYLPYEQDKLARIAEQVFDINEGNKEEKATKCILAFKDYFKKMDLPLSLREVGVKEEDIKLLTNIVSQNGSKVINHPTHVMDEEVMKNIYFRAL